jgi:uncharacterized protein (DUF885 family)
MDQSLIFNQFLADDWELRMQTDPLFATSTGDNRFNDRLPAISEPYYDTLLANLHSLETRLHQFDPSTLSSADRLNFEIYSRLLANEIGLLSFKTYRMPISKSGGFHTYFPELYLQMPMAGEQDYENYISRLASFQQYTAGHIEIMQAGIRDGQIPPRVTLEGVAYSIRSQCIPCSSNPLKRFLEWYPLTLPNA